MTEPSLPRVPGSPLMGGGAPVCQGDVPGLIRPLSSMGRLLLPGGLYPRPQAPAPHPAEQRRGNTGSSALLVPGSMSSKLERASGWRSSDFGVKIISWSGG